MGGYDLWVMLLEDVGSLLRALLVVGWCLLHCLGEWFIVFVDTAGGGVHGHVQSIH